LTGIDAVLGDTLEYRAPRDRDEPVLRMVSRYYVCRVADELGEQALDDYEARLGFRPAWIAPDQALATNVAIVTGPDRGEPPPWIRREILVLRRLAT
jgi:hypothetical protein